MITREQRGRESALLFAAVLDLVMTAVLLSCGLTVNSLTSLSEGVRGAMMMLLDLVSLAVMRRLHRGALAGFEFGTGKIEQLCSLLIAAGLGACAVWIGRQAIDLAIAGHSYSTPFGLTLAAVCASINLYANFIAWDGVRKAAQGRPSAIMRAQLHSRWTKLLSSLLVQITMTVAAVAKDPVIVAVADATGALLVCAVMLRAAWALVAEAVPDLVDRSTGDIAGAALRQAALSLPAGFSLQGFRSRGTPRAFVLEVALACVPGTDVAAARHAEHTLVAGLARILPDTELSLSVLAIPSAA